MVAPVSPSDLAKAKTPPESSAGRERGKMIFLKVVKAEAPRVRDARSNAGSKSSSFA